MAAIVCSLLINATGRNSRWACASIRAAMCRWSPLSPERGLEG